MRAFYQILNKASGKKDASIDLFDEIGDWGVSAAAFSNELKEIKATGQEEIQVRISSPGGDAMQGMAMFHALRASGLRVTTVVYGVAASAASIVFMAGDVRRMPKNTNIMIHNVAGFAGGDADDLRAAANGLDAVYNSLRGIYMSRAGRSDKEMDTIMATDSWFDADAALKQGFATEVVEAIEATAKFDMKRAELPTNVAKAFKNQADPEDPTKTVIVPPNPVDPVDPDLPLAEQVQALAKAAGLVEAHASIIVLNSISLVEAKARIGRAREIQALCVFAKADPAVITGFIDKDTPMVDVRKSLVEARAKADEGTDTSSARKNEADTKANIGKSNVTTATLWASHNAATGKQGKQAKKGN